jgi:hypothetical protein
MLEQILEQSWSITQAIKIIQEKKIKKDPEDTSNDDHHVSNEWM